MANSVRTREHASCNFDGLYNVLAECGQEINVVARLCHVLQQSLGSLECTFATLLVCQCREHAAHDNNGAHRAIVKQQFLAPCAGASNIDGGENAALSQSAFKYKFHVTSAFEFFVDHLIHTATSLN